MSKRDACLGPIRAATKGAFSDADIERVIDGLILRNAEKKAAKPALSDEAALREAASELTIDEVKRAMVSRRAKAYGELAKKQRLRDYTAMSGTWADKLEAMTIGNDKAGFGGRNSVDAMATAFTAELVGDLEAGLRKAGVWTRASGSVRDLNWQKNVAIEMARLNGSKDAPTGDASAVAAAEVMAPLIEKGRQMQNGVGAYIGKLEGYVARQNHDPVKVAGGFWRDLGKFTDGQLNEVQTQAFNAWHDAIAPRLSDETFADMRPTDKGTAADRRAFLQAVWFNIVTGDHTRGSAIGDDIDGFLPKSGKARAVSAERVLHFKSAGDWWDYHLTFGRGDLFGAVTGDLQRAAQNTALMKRFGPNPEIAWANDLKRFSEEARQAGDMRQGQKIASSRMQSAFDQVAGISEAPENLRVAHVGQLMRKHQSVTKLGGMVLSAFPDIGVGATHLMDAGVPFLEAYQSVFSGILRLDGRARAEAADMLDVMARTSIGHLTSGVTTRDGALGWYTYLGRMNFALQGFDFWNGGLRGGVAWGFARHLGRHAGKDITALPKGLQNSLARFGIDAKGWEAIRAGVQTVDGQAFVAFDHIKDEGLRMRAKAMVNDVMDNATSESRARERRDMDFGQPPGSVLGETLRAFFQFKSFAFALVNRSLIPAGRAAAQGNGGPLVNLIVSTMLLGMLSVQAKQLVKGREPRPIDGKMVLAALVQGGGLGIYGDFLFGERNRFGGGLAETFGGPMIGDFSQLVSLYDKIRRGDDAGASAFKLVKSEIPFANLWYTRAALDYLIFWRMQEAINPGWAARYQRQTEKQTGAPFLLKPTEAVQ